MGRRESLNDTEIEIMRRLQDGKMSVSGLAAALSISPAWASECVSHLSETGFVDREKKGTGVTVGMSQSPIGTAASFLIRENAMLKLEAVLTGSGLKILMLVQKPGCDSRSIAARASISLRTARGVLARWRGMGILTLKDGVYAINPAHTTLSAFARSWAEHINSAILKEKYPNAVIVWQWRDEFIFTSDGRVSDDSFKPAGPTRLEELNYDIIGRTFYYQYRPDGEEVSEAEALVQTVMIDPLNPRPLRHLRNAKVSKAELAKFAEKYGLKLDLKNGGMQLG
ncbi:MAG: hypothetical protein V1934_00585 [Methanobacteriota archaeon]